MLVGFAISFMSQGRCNGPATSSTPQQVGTPIATIGKYSATDAEVNGLAGQQRQQSSSPADQANAYASSLGNVIDHVAQLQLAYEHGIEMDDDKAKAAIPSLWSQQLDAKKQSLISDGKLKPNATEKEFQDAFKTANGISLEDDRKDWESQFDAVLTDPVRHNLVLAEIAFQSLREKYVQDSQVTEMDLRNSYNTYSVQHIGFEGKTGAEGKALAQKALDDIKGGMSFEDAIKKYNTSKVQPGKKATDTTEIMAQFFQFIPQLKPLGSLKEGEVSPPIEMPTSTSIYKVIKIKQTLPPDYDKNKLQLMTDMKKAAAQTKMKEDLDAIKSADRVQWKNPAYKLAYDYGQIQADFSAAPDQKQARYKDVQDRASAMLSRGGTDTRVVALILYAANEALYQPATAAEKKKMAPVRITALQAALSQTEDPALHVELADLLLGSGRAKEAVEELKKGAETNTSLSPEAQKVYNGLVSELDKLKEQKKIEDPDAKAIQDKLDEWLKNKRDQARMEAEAKVREAKLQAEAAKAMQSQAKPSTPAPSGTAKSSTVQVKPTATPAKPTGK